MYVKTKVVYLRDHATLVSNIHLVRQVSEEIPIIFVDTGYLFPGTYQYALTLQAELGFKAHTYSARKSPAFQEAQFGKLWEQGPQEMVQYNMLNKKEFKINFK